MGEQEKNIPPYLYHSNDPDLILELWKELVDVVAEEEKTKLLAFRDIVDPDLTPVQYVDLMLASLGNPFKNIFLTTLQKRKLIKLLIPIYRQKGLGRGIENVVRFMTGIELSVLDPHKDYLSGWQVGISEVGESLFVGGDRYHTNLLSASEDFDAEDWVYVNADSASDADEEGPGPWARTPFSLNLSSASSTLSQTVTPKRTDNQKFTASIWIKASVPVTLQGQIIVGTSTINKTLTPLSVTTEWQRFEFHHTAWSDSDDTVTFRIGSSTGTPATIHIWGAQLVRSRVIQPYSRTLVGEGADATKLGRWGYHFFIVLGNEITDAQEDIIRFIANYMKTEHTHYQFLTPGDEGVIDHWEVGISRIGVNNFVHE